MNRQNKLNGVCLSQSIMFCALSVLASNYQVVMARAAAAAAAAAVASSPSFAAAAAAGTSLYLPFLSRKSHHGFNMLSQVFSEAYILPKIKRFKFRQMEKGRSDGMGEKEEDEN